MNTKLKIAITGASGAALLGLLWFQFSSEPKSSPSKAVLVPSTAPANASPDLAPTILATSTPSAPRPPESESVKQTAALKMVGGKLFIKAGEPIPELFPHQAERDELIRLASTYDTKNIPKIADSLSHADASVRDTARQALVQIGDGAAIPYLRAASKTAREPEEIESLNEAIQFLSLPHISEVLTLSANAAKPSAL